MDPEQFAKAMERLSSDLSSLAFEQKQERLEWRRAMEAQSAELQHLLERQDAMQIRQDELETFAIEIEEQLQGGVKELSAQIKALSERLDRLDQGQERQESALADLNQEVAGLSRTTDEVFDDITDRVGVFERTLTGFDLTLSKQYEVLTDSLQEARDQLTEGLAEAHEAAEGHADGIVELKDAIATYQERREALDADAREQLLAMRGQILEHQAGVSASQKSLRQEFDALSQGQQAAFKDLDSQLSARMSSLEAALQQLDTSLGAMGSSQAETTRRLETLVSEGLSHAQREREALQQWVSQLGGQGQLLAQALESVQQGSIKAEEQLGAAMSEQFTTLMAHLEQTSQALQGHLGQTQHHLKEFEAKVAKALGLQRNENQEHERQLTALREELLTLGNRVGTIVQLLTKASQPPRAPFDTSAS